MAYRRRRTPSISRWIVGAVFLAVAVLAGSALMGVLGSGGGDGASADSLAMDSTARARAQIRVEVLNGAGDPGAAERVARRIRDRGFDVVYFGNASRFDYGVTHVVDRSEETDGARVLARVLSLDSLSTDFQPELFLDATLVLGEDWEERFPEATGSRLGDIQD